MAIFQSEHVIAGPAFDTPLPGLGILAISDTILTGQVEMILQSGTTVTLPVGIIRQLFPVVRQINSGNTDIPSGEIYVGFDSSAALNLK